MPNADRAIVDLEKVREYCLNRLHPRGWHKARLFEAALGLTEAHAEQREQALPLAAQSEDAAPGETDDCARRYVIDFTMPGPAGARKGSQHLNRSPR